MNLNKFLFISLLFFCRNLLAQNSIELLHYRNRIENSNLFLRDSIQLHSSVLPLINFNQYKNHDPQPGQLNISLGANTNNSKGEMRFYPLSDLSFGIESGTNSSSLLRYDVGLGAGFDFQSTKWIVTGKLLPYTTQSNFTADSIQNFYSMDLGTTRPISGYVFQRSELIVAYQPHRIFTFLGGYGKNFFGEGYRSLFLSDNAANYPFLKIETAFAGIKYVNLYSIWNDNSVNPANKSLDQMKFSATHYLSWNIIREINLSIFETVIWQAKDSLANRGFDLHYLNPLVFYRPVEYNMGSSDNVLLGASLNVKPNKHHCFYSQLLLDEFLLSQIKSGNKWWGNKYGIQIGYKTNSLLKQKLYAQIEFNVVRPFTYSHKYSVQNYGHLNASVAHPIGANFYELLNIINYQTDKFSITNKMTFAAFGADVDSVNYGQNIFMSYADRPADYGQKIMQGQRRNVFNQNLIIEFPLLKNIELYLFANYNYRLLWTSDYVDQMHFFSIGLRSRIWNYYSDF